MPFSVVTAAISLPTRRRLFIVLLTVAVLTGARRHLLAVGSALPRGPNSYS